MRLESRPSGGHRYLVAVKDEQQPDGSWRKVTVRSFGREESRRALMAAVGFATAIGAHGLADEFMRRLRQRRTQPERAK